MKARQWTIGSIALVMSLIALLGFGIGRALAAEGDPHQVVVCKYVGTPGVDERLQTGNNPIVVDTHALEGDGFDGTFPFEFSDAQGNSIAIRYAENSHDGDISECPGYVSPTPTPTPTETPTPTDTPTPSTPPTHHTKTPPPPDKHVTFCVAHPKDASCNIPPAMTGFSAGSVAVGAALLLLAGLGSLWFARRRSIG